MRSRCVQVTIDGAKPARRAVRMGRWCYYHRLSSIGFGSNLGDKEHAVTVELLAEAPDRAEPVAEAKRLGQYDAEKFRHG